MSVAFTSRLAYLSLQESLGGLQREVWQAIRDWPTLLGPSIQDIAVHLGKKEASICGRIKDGPLKPGRCGVQVKTYSALVWREPINVGPQLELELETGVHAS